MKKAWVFLILGILIISSAFAVQQAKGHKGAQIDFKVGANAKDLDSAFDSNGNYKVEYYTITSPDNLIFGHKPSEVFVNVNGVVKNFSTALTDGSLRDTVANRSPANYNGYNVVFGETANNVMVNVNGAEESLQDAVNSGAFFLGCYDGATVRLSGSTWTIKEPYYYDCNCGKSGCDTCAGDNVITKRCNNRVIS